VSAAVFAAVTPLKVISGRKNQKTLGRIIVILVLEARNCSLLLAGGH
jgi:hypothetical protein